jgi:hypothetical protein
MPSLRRIVLHLACASAVAALLLPATVLEAQQPALRTWQEENEFKAGPTPFEPLMKFWYELARQSDLVSIRPLTRTLLDREFTLVTISKDPIANPQDAMRRQDHRAHRQRRARQRAGRQGSLAARRPRPRLRRPAPVLDSAIVLFVPLINPDGGEVRRRTNEEGFDMNRDYSSSSRRRSTPRHAGAERVDAGHPHRHAPRRLGPVHAHLAGHAEPGRGPRAPRVSVRTVFPAIRAALRAEGYDGFDYSGAQTRDGVRGWGSTSVEPASTTSTPAS